MGEITTSAIHHWTYAHIRDRRTQTLLTRLRIGHTYLTKRYLLTRDPQPYCDDCLVPLTVRHLLVERPIRRQMTIDVATPKAKSIPPSIHPSLKENGVGVVACRSPITAADVTHGVRCDGGKWS
ncbi:hypothetical protein E2C01_006542 [Portunus trituberculatus]|uniref:Uncharacterized protein n=1 Tax=Portunus trituberculatus TaxID=210409 RepID=A0A5B7CYF9_PORTR|nr:hypothetical protein [Portunus trituberculatus]